MGVVFFLFLTPVIIALLAVIVIAVVGLVLLGAGATAIAAGGFAASAVVVKDANYKRLTVIVCSAVLLFALCCFSLFGFILWTEARTVLAVLGCLFGLGSIALGIVGLVYTRPVAKTSAKVLFIILFILTLMLGICSLAASGLALFAIL